MRLTIRPETKKSKPNGTMTAAAAIAMAPNLPQITNGDSPHPQRQRAIYIDISRYWIGLTNEPKRNQYGFKPKCV